MSFEYKKIQMQFWRREKNIIVITAVGELHVHT